MNRTLYKLISKLNFTNKDKAEFINALNSEGDDLENRVRELERKINEITENE